MSRCRTLVSLIAVLLASGAAASGADRRPISLDDLARLREVSDPQISPDGNWVAYTVASEDQAADQEEKHVWMTSWDGTQSLRLTAGKDEESLPRWSPDGKFLAFLSDRGDESEAKQLWLMALQGGEAEKITDFKGGVTDLDWSPDGKRLVLVVDDPDPDAPEKGKEKPVGKAKTKKPIVIDRFQFKEDETGYLTKARSHLYLFDRETLKSEALTSGGYDERLPAWSPDGKAIAFVSKRGPDFDRTENWDVFSIEPRAGAVARQLTTFEGPDEKPDWESRPAWSPDGRWVAYLEGGPARLIDYAVHKLAVVPAAGGPPRILTPDLDRNVTSPRFSRDGASILFLLEDDRVIQLARVPFGGGAVDRVVSGRETVTSYTVSSTGRVALLLSTAVRPDEVFALDGAEPRPLSRQNDGWLAQVVLGAVEETSFKSKDGTEIHGFLVRPPDYQPGRRYPAVLRIHGGPVWQYYDDFQYKFEWQWLAANGYVVVAANPRGSSGRGEKFALGIFADWGHKDAQDVLAAVDDAVRRGLADPERLGIGGWSYGGILTNYVIAQDSRFAAATSGAGASNILAGYGTDQYVRDYEAELGPPWKNSETWIRLSFPFLHADRIKTPTLFLCGEADFNVPLLNSEQMYQALRSLGVPTQLVIYPGQYHGLTRPSYLRDRLERYAAWYDKYVKPGRAPASAAEKH